MSELEIEHPSVRCGDCGFTSWIHGEWSVEDGRLVFRAAADPLPGRGASLDYCGESSEIAEFTRIRIDEHFLPDDEFAALKDTAAKSR